MELQGLMCRKFVGARITATAHVVDTSGRSHSAPVALVPARDAADHIRFRYSRHELADDVHHRVQLSDHGSE